MQTSSVEQAFHKLWGLDRTQDNASLRVAAAFTAFAGLWERRLAEGWTPPNDGITSFPWAMVRLSLTWLLPGFRDAESWQNRASVPPVGRETRKTKVAALVLAGNTPLLSWQPLAACLLAGYTVYVKMSRGETLWPRLFVEALSTVDPEIASRIHLDVWPGESDPRTGALLENADAVIAYGSDAAITSLRAMTPPQTPFFGYGHAVSVGIVGSCDKESAAGFARDILMYGQQGCLSPVALFVENAVIIHEVADRLAEALREEAPSLHAPPVTDAAVARTVRQARDLALFYDTVRVLSDETLRWTILAHQTPAAISPPVGHGFVELIPLPDAVRNFGAALGCVRGRVSCVGVSGQLSPEVVSLFQAEGAGRVCAAGEMQTPALDWPNGGFDLLAALKASF